MPGRRDIDAQPDFWPHEVVLVKARRRGARCNKLRGQFDRASRTHKRCRDYDDEPCIRKTARQRNLALNLARKMDCKWARTRRLRGVRS